MMRSQRAAHGVEVNRDAGGHNDRLRMKISQVTGSTIDDEHADEQNDRGDRAGFGAVVAAGHPQGTHRIALNDRGKLGDAADR